jgi:hypothetical protein
VTQRAELPNKLASEVKTVTFDFTSMLAAGETISTQSCTATVYSGTDASPSAIISGSATASGAVASQKITGGTVGVIYSLACSITTSAGQTLKLAGFLAVLPDLP